MRDTFWGPQLLAFLPAICLAAYWLVGEGGLIAVALGLPFVWGIFGGFQIKPNQTADARAEERVTSEGRIADQITSLISDAQEDDRCAIFAMSLVDGEGEHPKLDDAGLSEAHAQITRRLTSILRSDDLVFLSGAMEWIIALKPGPRLDLEVAIQQASRLQSVTDTPLIAGGIRHYATSTLGFCLVRPTEDRDSTKIMAQAKAALRTALMSGPGSIRAYQDELTSPEVARAQDRSTIEHHDLSGVVAWYQPQISTDTGTVCGFEALARLRDPEKGILPPAAFLPALERAGQLEKLSERMLAQGLEALKTWDAAGLSIETVGVNYSAQDLANPKLYDKIAWELDRHDIPPHRLAVEVLETVIAAGKDDMITRNVSRLAKLGCQIDLDDFGTGHASISTLRRLPVSRLKIDRTFVARADLDSEQQKMVATILMMAERLGLMTLAEGVETVGEHAILAQLGCRYVQGYGIAKPMPLDDTIDWVQGYQARLARSPRIDRKTG